MLAMLWFVFTGHPAQSQSFFQNTYPLPGYSAETGAVARLPNGQIALGGLVIKEQTGAQDAAILLFSSTGDLIWARQFDTGVEYDRITDLVATADNKLLAVFGKQYVSQGVSGIALLKQDGTLEWSKKYSLPADVLTRVTPLTGGFLLTGSSDNPQSGLAVKIGDDGQEIWRKTIDQPGSALELHGAWEDPQGFLYITGQVTTGGLSDGLLVKMSAIGKLEWMQRIGTGENAGLPFIQPLSGDQLLLGGYTFALDGYSRAWLVRSDWSGKIKWSRSYHLNGDDLTLTGLAGQDDAAVMALTGLGNAPNLGAGLAQINNSGDLLWIKKYDPNGQIGRNARLTPAGNSGFLLAADLQAGGGHEFYVVRTDAAGDVPPCCFKSANLQVSDLITSSNPLVPDVYTPAVLENTGWSLVPFTTGKTALCTALDLDFTLSDSMICPGECIDLTIENPVPGVNYTWTYPGGTPDAGKPNRVCFPGATADVSITLTADGCQQHTRTLKIGVAQEQFPNAFTPNGDQNNDRFQPLLYCPVMKYHFQVYNRWGELMFESFNPSDGWDGIFNGVDAPSDVYAWVVEFQSSYDKTGEMVRKRGSVSLLR